jgi:hypothetical protein
MRSHGTASGHEFGYGLTINASIVEKGKRMTTSQAVVSSQENAFEVYSPLYGKCAASAA